MAATQTLPTPKDLNRQEIAFSQEYVQCLDIDDAAKRVWRNSPRPGFLARQAMNRAEVAEYIDSLWINRSLSTELTTREVLYNLRELRDQCMGRKPVKQTVTKGGKSKVVEVYKYNAAVACRALELLGKAAGLFEDGALDEKKPAAVQQINFIGVKMAK